MAGHSHAKNVMHKKAAMNQKKAKIYTKHSKAISVAIKLGGNDLDSNFKLKFALKQAQIDNVPKDVIKKALEKKEKENIEEILFEGYIQGGIGILVQVITDNKNRTASQIRELFNKNNIKIAQPNAVKFLFDYLGIIEIEKNDNQDEFIDLALKLNAIDIQENLAFFPSDMFYQAQTEIEKKFTITEAKLSYVPKIEVESNENEQLLKILEKLEENEDIQEYWHNHKT